MRRLAPILLLCLMAAACSRSQASKLQQDTQTVGHDVASDVRSVSGNPDLKAASDQVKTAAQDTSQDLKKAGQDIADHTKAAADKTKDAVND